MKNTFTLFISILLFNNYITNLCSTLKEFEEEKKDILEGNGLEYLAERGEKLNWRMGNFLIKLKTKADITIIQYDLSDSVMKRIDLLKKLTKTYSENEFKPFTYFIGCVINDDDKTVNLLFGNLGMSLENSSIANKFMNLSVSKGLVNGSNLLRLISKFGSFNPKIQVLLTNESFLFKEMENGELKLIVNLLNNNLFDENFEIEKSKALTPETIEEQKHYYESNIFESFMFTIMSLKDIHNEINNHPIEGKYLSTFLETLNEENNLKNYVTMLKNTSTSLNLKFEEPNAFNKFTNWFLGIFTDRRVESCYTLEDLVETVLTFKKEDRPNPLKISEKLLFFSQNFIEPASSSSKIIL